MSLRSLLLIGRTFEPSDGRSGRFRPAARGLVPDFSRGQPEGRSLRDTPNSPFQVSTHREDSRPRATGRRLPLWLERAILTLLRTGNRRRGSRQNEPATALEAVEVVRNDLTISDVEVVRVRSHRAGRLSSWWAAASRKLSTWRRREP